MLNYRTTRIAVGVVGIIGVLAFFIAYLAKGPGSAAESNSLSPSNQVKEIDGYKTWTKVNSTPLLMPARVAMACAVDVRLGYGVDGQGNPHRDKFLTVYVNDLGRRAMLTEKYPKFPVGSTIVKEKLPTVDSQALELLTVMIKQQKGFNPATGDWEYMVVDGAGLKIEARGKLDNCQGCHLKHPKTDYVFRTYLPAEVESKLK